MRILSLKMNRSVSNLKPEQRVIDSQTVWVIGNEAVELAVTKLGAHMAPVTFFKGSPRPIQPYYISPWQTEKAPVAVPVLKPLRGDFFCLPFGGNNKAFRDEQHPPHGEPCGEPWQLESYLVSNRVTTLGLRFKTKVRLGCVRRELSLVAGQNVIYSRTVIEGFAGPTPFAHHAMLAAPSLNSTLHLSCSPFSFGRTHPKLFSDPAAGEYQSIVPDKCFRNLAKLPSIFRDYPDVDGTVFPAWRGFCDLVQVFEKPGTSLPSTPSWMAAVNKRDGWAWFALKDPRVMPGCIFWMENHGRHSPPWNGRNACLGIEDGCMYFDLGLAESCGCNQVNRQGVPTCVKLSGRAPFEVRYIQGMCRILHGFDRVAQVRFGKEMVALISENGWHAKVSVFHNYLFSKSDNI